MKVIAIDVDGTALEHPEKVNALFENRNNFIVLYTARTEKVREATVRRLKVRNVKYHALVMEKIRADVYIDNNNAGGLKWI